MTLLTPGPQYAGQYGKTVARRYEAVEHQGRLKWRAIPIWDLLTHADFVAREYLGQRIATLRNIKGLPVL